MRAGESRTFELTFPEDYHGKEVAGKTASFDVTVKRVAEPVVPEANADFAKALGIADGDLDKMRADVKGNLEREVRRRRDARVKDQVMKALLENSSIELPKALVQMESERLMEGMRRDLEARGLKSDQIPMPAEAFEPEAKKRVTLGLIIAELVKREGPRAPSPIRSRRWCRITHRATRDPRRWCAGTISPPTACGKWNLWCWRTTWSTGRSQRSRSRTSRPISTN